MEGKVIKKLLKDNTEINTILGDRIYAVVTPQNITYPYINYAKSGNNRTTTQGFKKVSEESIYQINIYAQDYLDIIRITEAIKSALDYKHNITVADLKVSTIIPINEQDSEYDQKSNVYYRFLIYELSINKT